MPILQEPDNPRTILLPPRRATVGAESQVLVVGGGPAGFGAALGAAAAGADVVLTERYAFLGGNATVALVMPLMSFHNETKQALPGEPARLMPTDHGAGEPVVGGVLYKLLRRLADRGGAIWPSPETGYTVPFDPEQFKLIAMEMVDEAGVWMLFHAFASGTAQQRDIRQVVFESKSGPVVIEADVVVDCTGDGDVAAAAGAPYEIGRDDGLAQPMTLMFRMVDVVAPRFAEYVREHPDQWRGVHGLWELIEKATDAGELDLPRDDILFFATPHPHEVSVNSTRVTRCAGVSVWDLSWAECAARRQMDQIARFLRRHVPGFEESYVVQSGVQVGVRETRRIIGEYKLTGHDILTARKFPDAIARGAYPVDIHDPDGAGTVLRRVPHGEAYDIPLRCLIPKNTQRLIVAGRCISGTHVAHSSYRIMPIAMATGQAAGVCAALAARTGRDPREVPASDVQRELLAQGASLREGVSV